MLSEKLNLSVIFLFWSRRMHLHLKSFETSSNHSSLYQRCRCCPAEWGCFLLRLGYRTFCRCSSAENRADFRINQVQRERQRSIVVLSMAYSGFLNLNLCFGAYAITRSRISSNKALKISGLRRFIASESVDFATASMPR